VDVTAIVPLPEELAARPAAVSQPVAGQSPLVRVVHELASTVSVVVAAAPALVFPARELLGAAGLSRFRVVGAESPGGRAQCIAAGLAQAGRGSHVLVHDVGWPLVDPDVVGRVVAALRAGAPVVVPARPVTDTIKTVDARGDVTATVDRTTLQVLQFPRGFAVDALTDVLARQRPGDSHDEMALAMAHHRVELVAGDPGAFDVELPRDADYLAAVIEVAQRDSVR
jgi:2-C-methyl-D-erythritol 4-phosphate cytidylyltransferase